MIGAIAGDIVGSIYEFDNIKSKDFELFPDNCFFTDDSVLTVALADAILNDTDYGERLKHWFQRYPDASYGGNFRHWALADDGLPYNSWGNGSAMRVSPVAFAWDEMNTVLAKAQWSAAFTHNHPEGIKGAQATAAAILLARQGASKTEIKEYVAANFDYALNEPLASIRDWYAFDVSCQGSVPQAIIAFLEAEDFEDTLRNAVSIGGDSDTIACIAGGIAEAFYGVPAWIERATFARLDAPLAEIIRAFRARYG